MSENFFERWSRRKQQGEAAPPEEPKLPPPLGEGRGGGAAAPAAGAGAPPPGLPPAGEGERAPPPTLADTESLTPDSDFKPFVARNVAPEVRNAAMKKLFADPHFNVMDRMDVYIDDYSNPAPLPAASLRKMASAVFLKLVDDDEEEEARKKKALQETPPMSSVQDVAQSGHPSPLPAQEESVQSASQETDDDHADLRLQQDDAPDADPRRGAG